MMNCQDIVHIVASDELTEAGWSVRLRVRLHMLMCRHCRSYAAQMRTIGEAARNLLRFGPQDSPTLNQLKHAISQQSFDEPEDPTQGGDT